MVRVRLESTHTPGNDVQSMLRTGGGVRDAFAQFGATFNYCDTKWRIRPLDQMNRGQDARCAAPDDDDIDSGRCRDYGVRKSPLYLGTWLFTIDDSH